MGAEAKSDEWFDRSSVERTMVEHLDLFVDMLDWKLWEVTRYLGWMMKSRS